MPGYLLFMRTWKGFADDFPFEDFDGVDDASIRERLEGFCYEQLQTPAVRARIRDRRRAMKAAVARLRSQRMHPPTSREDKALHQRLENEGMVSVEKVHGILRFKPLDEEFCKYAEMGLSLEQAADVRFMERLGPEGRMAHAKIIAGQNERADLEARSQKGELCMLDSLSGTQRRWVQVDRKTGERRYTLRRKDPKAPSLGCRIAYATGWLTEPLTKFGEQGLSPSPLLFVGTADAPVVGDEVAEALRNVVAHDPDWNFLCGFQLRFHVSPATGISAGQRASHPVVLKNLMERKPENVQDAIQKYVASELLQVLEELQAAQPASDSAESESASAATAAQKTREKNKDRTTDTLAELERKTPPFDRNSGLWVTNKNAGETENLNTRTLADYRQDGIKNTDGTLGRDKDGRVWRRKGTPMSHPWYLRSSLVSIRAQEKPAKQNRR